MSVLNAGALDVVDGSIVLSGPALDCAGETPSLTVIIGANTSASAVSGAVELYSDLGMAPATGALEIPAGFTGSLQVDVPSAPSGDIHHVSLRFEPFTGTVSIDAIGSSCPTIVPAVSAGGLVISEVAFEASDLSHRALQHDRRRAGPETSRSPSTAARSTWVVYSSASDRAAGRSRRTATPSFSSTTRTSTRIPTRRRPYARVLSSARSRRSTARAPSC